MILKSCSPTVLRSDISMAPWFHGPIVLWPHGSVSPWFRVPRFRVPMVPCPPSSVSPGSVSPWFRVPMVPFPHSSVSPQFRVPTVPCPHGSVSPFLPTPMVPRPPVSMILSSPLGSHTAPLPPLPTEGGKSPAGQTAAQPRGLCGGLGSTLGSGAFLQPHQGLQSVPSDGERCCGGETPSMVLPAPQCCPQPPSVALSPPALLSAPSTALSPQHCSQPPVLLSAPSVALSPTPPSCGLPSQLQGCILCPQPHGLPVPFGFCVLFWGPPWGAHLSMGVRGAPFSPYVAVRPPTPPPPPTLGSFPGFGDPWGPLCSW